MEEGKKRVVNASLLDKRILVTRALEQADELVKQLELLGASAISLPMIRVKALTDPITVEEVNNAFRSLVLYDWILFTSVNGVKYFFQWLEQMDLQLDSLQKARIAAVGNKTAKAIREKGLSVDVVPSLSQAEGLVDSLKDQAEAGQHVFLPTADKARDILPKKLREMGLKVTEIDMYETVPCLENGAALTTLLSEGFVDAITFTSPSTVHYLFLLLKDKGILEPYEVLQGVSFFCIGPVTAKALTSYGFFATGVAKKASVASLIDSISTYL